MVTKLIPITAIIKKEKEKDMALNIIIHVKNEKSQGIIDAFKTFYPIPTDASGTPLYDEEDWPEIRTKQWVAEVKWFYDQSIQVLDPDIYD